MERVAHVDPRRDGNVPHASTQRFKPNSPQPTPQLPTLQPTQSNRSRTFLEPLGESLLAPSSPQGVPRSLWHLIARMGCLKRHTKDAAHTVLASPEVNRPDKQALHCPSESSTRALQEEPQVQGSDVSPQPVRSYNNRGVSSECRASQRQTHLAYVRPSSETMGDSRAVAPATPKYHAQPYLPPLTCLLGHQAHDLWGEASCSMEYRKATTGERT